VSTWRADDPGLIDDLPSIAVTATLACHISLHRYDAVCPAPSRALKYARAASRSTFAFDCRYGSTSGAAPHTFALRNAVIANHALAPSFIYRVRAAAILGPFHAEIL
jgi:hypothetical protein